MNKEGTKKKTAPVLEHQGEQGKVGAAALAGTTTPVCDSTTDTMTTQAVKVSEFLLRGQENALPLKHLKGLLHTDGRTVRLMIRTERLSGVPICEDSKTGYFLPDSARERDLCAARLRHRANEITKTADAIAAADVEGAADLD